MNFILYLLVAICAFLGVVTSLFCSILVNEDKLSHLATKYVLFGYRFEHEGYSCYDPSTRRPHNFQYVTFVRMFPLTLLYLRIYPFIDLPSTSLFFSYLP